MKKALLFFAFLLFIVLYTTAQPFVFTPQWTAQAQFAGYYVAEAKGFYREAGVNVRIEHPSATQPAMNRLRKNQCQATTLQLCQALEIVDDGIPLVNILQTSMNNAMVIVSESPKCGAMYYAERVKKEFPEFDVRVSILGHLQRGGTPSARDRILASCTGVGAIEAILQGQRNVMVGVRNNDVVYVPFSECIRTDKRFDKRLINVLDELSI